MLSGFFDVASIPVNKWSGSHGGTRAAVGVLLLNILLRCGRGGAGQFGEEGGQYRGAAQGPFGVSCALLTGAQLWDGDRPDASPPNPCTVVGHGGTGVLPVLCL